MLPPLVVSKRSYVNMWGDLGVRFLLGGAIVSLFALLGDVFKPKSFAGLFSAAPSVALATLGLAFYQHGGGYTSLEGRSMLVGAMALVVYSQLVSHLMMRCDIHSTTASILGLLSWVGTAFGLWFFVLR
jgi:hypothetical protein